MYKKVFFLGLSILMAATMMITQSCGKEVVYVYNEPSDNSGGNGGNTSNPTDTPTIDFEALINGAYTSNPSQNETAGYFLGIHNKEKIGYSYYKNLAQYPYQQAHHATISCRGTFSLSNITVLETDYSGSPKKFEATLIAQYSDVSVDEDGVYPDGGTLNGYTHNQPCTKTHHIVWKLGNPTYLVIDGVSYKKS